MRTGSIIFYLFFLSLSIAAQQPVYRHISEDNGLPDNEVYYLLQDKKGIIWISTNSGLCRYNGQSFQFFSNPQLKAKSTGCIREDSFGRIWVSNFAGQLFYVQADSITIVQLPGIRNINNSAPFAIGPGNQLIVATETGEIAVYRSMHKKHTDPPQYVMDTVLKEMGSNPYVDPEGKLWAIVTGDEYLKQWKVGSWNNGRMEFFSFYPEHRQKGRYTGFVFKQNKETYFFEREQNSLFKLKDGLITDERKTKLPGFKMVEPLQNGYLAFCTNSGLYISDERLPSPSIVTRLFPGQTISAFCEDKKGNLWVGTLSEGIYFIPKQGLQQIVSGHTEIDYNNITSLCTGPAGKLVVGFLNGEIGWLDNNFRYATLYPANRFSSKAQSLFYSESMQLLNWYTDNAFQSHFTAADKQLHPYLGVGYSTKDMVYLPNWKAALLANPVDIQLTSLDETPLTQRLPAAWANKYDTITLADKSGTWSQQSLLLTKERGRAVYFDTSTGTCWGADKNGITLYRSNRKSALLLNNEPVYATNFAENNGIVWAATFSQGIIAFKEEQPVKQYTVKEGLASNTVYKIIGSGGHLWISTDKGLQYFDTDKEKFYLLDKSLGLPSFKINGIALAGGLLYVSTPKGLFSIADNIRFDWDTSQQVYLQAVYCNNAVVNLSQSIFGVSENNFIFKAETPVYSNRALLRYRYRLKGTDKDFTITTPDNAVFEYKGLQSGSYEFQLYLTDTKGNTIGEPFTWSFTIRPPFYRTTWFRVIVLMLIAAMIWLLFRRRLTQVQKRENEKLRLAQLQGELNQSQLAGIKAQMNPHFMFNALNSIQEFILLNDKRQANMYMGKFADLMRMTLDMSNKKEVVLDDEIKMLQLYLELESLRFEEQFTWSIHTNGPIDKEHILIPAMLIQPHIENAVKHGLLHKSGDKKLDILFFMKTDRLLCCTVTDNGIGRRRSEEINAQRIKKHTSFATGAMQKRLELLNFQQKEIITMQYDDLADASGNAAGTKVTLTIPVQVR